MAKYKSNIQKAIIFLYTNNNLLDIVIDFKKIPVTTTPRTINCPGEKKSIINVQNLDEKKQNFTDGNGRISE